MLSPGKLGPSGSLKLRKHGNPRPKKVRQIWLPGIGRIAFTTDPGDGFMFGTQLFETRFRMNIRDSGGRLMESLDLGSGLVTNVGVLALAYDAKAPGVATNLATLLANLKWHAWGTGATAAATTDIKLQTPGAPTASKAVSGTLSIVNNGAGEPKFVSTAIITAESSLAITEWGIFGGEELAQATGEPLTAETANSGTVTGTPLTASSATAKGETGKILNASESEDIWGLITSNTTSVVTVPAWYKTSTGAEKQPSATSKYTLRPVMWDHKVFGAVNVESGNKIEGIYELLLKSGG